MRAAVVLLTLMLIASACGGSNGVAPAETRPSTTAAHGATATRPATRASLVVFLRGNDLWAASLDGTAAPPRAITSGVFHAGFSGVAGRGGGGTDLYYVAQLSDQRVVDDRYEADFGLYRVPLEGGEPEELLRYQGRPLEPFLATNAAVSPDGKTVLYADSDGIALLDLASGDSRRLLTNSPPCGGPEGCFAYHRPRWSPAGDRALITKTFWEGGADILIDPLAASVSEVDTGGGGSFTARWSRDGSLICVSQYTYASAGAVVVYDLASAEGRDATLRLPLPTPADPGALRIDARGCAWSSDDQLAIGYIVPYNYTDVRVAIVDASYTVLAESEPIPNVIEVVAWLPDGSGVIFNRSEPQTGEPLAPGIYHTDGSVSDLPFEADRVLDVIP